MNTKIVMTSASIILGASGATLIFASDIVLSNLSIDINESSLLLGQVVGALYFGFAMLNWMTKESLIGGIYNRPVAVANSTHFMIAGLAILKAVVSNPELPKILWAACVAYVAFGILFMIILFRHPVKSKD
jgi:hypothetical protein